MMVRNAICALACALMLSATCSAKNVNITWHDCSAAGSHGKITDLTVLPNPPLLGVNTTINGHGSLDKAIADGQMSIKSSFQNLPIPVTPASIPACGTTSVKLPLGLGTVDVSGLSCPATVGDLDITEVLNIPAIAPAGTYTAELSGIDADSEQFLCVHLDIVVSGS